MADEDVGAELAKCGQNCNVGNAQVGGDLVVHQGKRPTESRIDLHHDKCLASFIIEIHKLSVPIRKFRPKVYFQEEPPVNGVVGARLILALVDELRPFEHVNEQERQCDCRIHNSSQPIIP